MTDLEAGEKGAQGLSQSWAARHTGATDKDATGETAAAQLATPQRSRRRRTSRLTRKIVTFNLVALNILVAGILYLNASGDGLAMLRANALVIEAELIADVFEAQLPRDAPVNLATNDGIDVARTLDGLDLRSGIDVYVYDTALNRIGTASGEGVQQASPTSGKLSDVLDSLYASFSQLTGADTRDPTTAQAQFDDDLLSVISRSVAGDTFVRTGAGVDGSTVFTVGSPILAGDTVLGALAIVSASGEIDALVWSERERVLQIFLITTLVSIGLSIALASKISKPITALADAAELGQGNDRGETTKGRVRIPDLTARSDEIGRLSGALRGMVTALYERIDANEQFAADVAHEIKNPLASLRSAVGTLRHAKRDDQREKLLSVIEHDVRRLDRLVSDISNASRLDSELVREDQAEFDLLEMIENLCLYIGEDAGARGIEVITDLPDAPIALHGLEARLAQVFVNLVTNAVSFCEDGDAIRVWVRQRKGRVLVVVEDTGPGIPEEALEKVFKRFYSHRPESDFGNNSGLGLAISKQIVEAHGGVIWAENIRPTKADLSSDPLGARFVVGLPV